MRRSSRGLGAMLLALLLAAACAHPALARSTHRLPGHGSHRHAASHRHASSHRARHGGSGRHSGHHSTHHRSDGSHYHALAPLN